MVNCSGKRISHDGGQIAAASSTDIQVWNVATSALIFTIPVVSDVIESLAFSPCGRRLTTASKRGRVRVWDPAAGVPLLEFRTLSYSGTVQNLGTIHKFPTYVTFSPDGTRILAATESTLEKSTPWVDAWIWDAAPLRVRDA